MEEYAGQSKLVMTVIDVIVQQATMEKIVKVYIISYFDLFLL